MAFPKGQSGNPAGRPAGSLNKTTAKAKKVFENLLFDHIDQLRNDIQTMTPERRVSALLKVAEFIIPKANASLDISLEYKELEKLLHQTPNEYLEAITQKIISLNLKANEHEH